MLAADQLFSAPRFERHVIEPLFVFGLLQESEGLQRQERVVLENETGRIRCPDPFPRRTVGSEPGDFGRPQRPFPSPPARIPEGGGYGLGRHGLHPLPIQTEDRHLLRLEPHAGARNGKIDDQHLHADTR